MLEINFLPWREERYLRKLKFIFVMVTIFFLLLIGLNKFVFQKTIVKKSLLETTHTAKINFDFLRDIHYVGYIKEKNKRWALLTQEDGSVKLFPENSIINKGRIINITDTSVNFLLPNNQLYLLHLSNT